MMPKAPPGKRYCKKCHKLIPIHSRLCPFCQELQYTREQIDKEDRKRKRDQDDAFEDEAHTVEVLAR